jgi:hypothetical protein
MTRIGPGAGLSPTRHTTGKRPGSLACGILYRFIRASTVTFLLGASQTSGGNQSKQSPPDSRVTPGRLLVLVIGLVAVGARVAIIVDAARKTFTKHLNLGPDEPMHPHGRGDTGPGGKRRARDRRRCRWRVPGRRRGHLRCEKARGLNGAPRKSAAAPLARGCSPRRRSA